MQKKGRKHFLRGFSLKHCFTAQNHVRDVRDLSGADTEMVNTMQRIGLDLLRYLGILQYLVFSLLTRSLELRKFITPPPPPFFVYIVAGSYLDVPNS
jgi:hypothetical protein